MRSMSVPPPKSQPRVGKLQEWFDHHRKHGRGPWKDAKLHVYYHWRCCCGEKFTYTDLDEAAAPLDYVVSGGLR